MTGGESSNATIGGHDFQRVRTLENTQSQHVKAIMVGSARECMQGIRVSRAK